MRPMEMSARFVAFVWYTKNRRAPNSVLQAKARRFSQKNWQAFLPVAHEDLLHCRLKLPRPAPARKAQSTRAGRRAQKIGSEDAMFHTLEFAEEFVVDLEVSPKHRLEQMRVRRGTRLQAQVKPYVVETEGGPVEVADLFFADGTAIRMVPFSSFSFVG
ncbi:MAG TPA: hypothetical protein VFE62_02340 [Gemmataceae bacterium]|nr:hypothetical protein [Gemmataceae bacterium]